MYPVESLKSINIKFVTIMDIINIVAMYSDFYEINYKGEIIITFPMQEKLQVEFIAILDINVFLLIIVICEYIY